MLDSGITRRKSLSSTRELQKTDVDIFERLRLTNQDNPVDDYGPLTKELGCGVMQLVRSLNEDIRIAQDRNSGDRLEEFMSLDSKRQPNESSTEPGDGSSFREPSDDGEVVESLDSVPVWIRGAIRPRKAQFFAQFHWECINMVRWLDPTPEEVNCRYAIWAKAEVMVGALWPGAVADPFGSFYNSIFLPSSDMDICVLLPPTTRKHCGMMDRIANVLEYYYRVDSLELIENAKVPLVKFVEQESGIQVDIALDQPSSFETSEYVREKLTQVPMLRPLLILVKLFLFMRGLGETYSGGVGSYLAFCMVLWYLNRWGNMHQNIGLHLMMFLQYYGSDFNYEKTGISVRQFSLYTKSNRGFISHRPHDRPWLLSMESPLDPKTDIGRNSYEIKVVKDSFQSCYNHLTMMMERNSDYPITTVLFPLTSYFKGSRNSSNAKEGTITGSRPPPSLQESMLLKVVEEMKLKSALGLNRPFEAPKWRKRRSATPPPQSDAANSPKKRRRSDGDKNEFHPPLKPPRVVPPPPPPDGRSSTTSSTPVRRRLEGNVVKVLQSRNAVERWAAER